MSNVLASKRTPSSRAMFIKAYKIRQELILYIMSDFNVMAEKKQCFRNPNRRLVPPHLADSLSFRHASSDIYLTYYKDIFDHFRDCILSNCHMITDKLTMASAIYPSNEDEYDVKIAMFSVAKAACYALISELQQDYAIIRKVCIINLDKYLAEAKEVAELIDMINDERRKLRREKKAFMKAQATKNTQVKNDTNTQVNDIAEEDEEPEDYVDPYLKDPLVHAMLFNDYDILLGK